MRTLRSALIVLMALPLLGCPTTPQQPLARPVVIQAQGTYTHSASGMVFPVGVGTYQRVVIRRYDHEGSDIGVGYNQMAPHVPLTATVYVYPAPSVTAFGSPFQVAELRKRVAQRELELHRNVILQKHPDAEIVLEDDVTLDGDAEAPTGRQAVFEYVGMFAGRRMPLRSHLHVFAFVGDDWIVKYRFTHRQGIDASKEIEQLMQAVPWTR